MTSSINAFLIWFIARFCMLRRKHWVIFTIQNHLVAHSPDIYWLNSKSCIMMAANPLPSGTVLAADSLIFLRATIYDIRVPFSARPLSTRERPSCLIRNYAGISSGSCVLCRTCYSKLSLYFTAGSGSFWRGIRTYLYWSGKIGLKNIVHYSNLFYRRTFCDMPGWSW